MAQNERRNSGSRRSRNERPDAKRNTGKKQRNSAGKEDGPRPLQPRRNQAFFRRQDNRNEGSPSSGDAGSAERNTSSKRKPFGGKPAGQSERFAREDRPERKRPFSKRDSESEKPRPHFARGDRRKDDTASFSGKRGFRTTDNFRKDEERRTERPQSRPFNRSDFTRAENGPGAAPESSDTRGAGKKPSTPRKGRAKAHGFIEKKPSRKERPVRKSFVESRLDIQRTAKPAQAAGAPKEEGLIRLNKFISNSGVCSRREADNRIAMGLVSVNGTTITEMGYKVKPTDEVRYEGKRLKAEKPVYILLNKPKGFITTTEDPQERHTVMNLIANACSERVYPVGRLDRNTTGLLLLTNDGDLADKLTHPSYNVKKIYKVELDKPITKGDFEQLAAGIRLEEGVAVPDDLAIVSDDRQTVGIELHIGWNRIVRRLFESLGYQVVKLDRVVYAGLDKKDLPRGNWRFLTQHEIVRLKHYK